MSGAKDRLAPALRDLRIELSVNTHRVARQVGLNDSDLNVLDVLTRRGPSSPTALARQCGLHPATLTGVLTRLERGGWLERRTSSTDRRSSRIEPSAKARLTGIYRDGKRRLEEIAATLTDEEAETIASYLHAVTEAVRAATAQLTEPAAETTVETAAARPR